MGTDIEEWISMFLLPWHLNSTHGIWTVVMLEDVNEGTIGRVLCEKNLYFKEDDF